MRYYDILLPVPTQTGVFSYTSETELHAGARVIVPLGKRELPGIVLRENLNPSTDYAHKAVLRTFDEAPLFHPEYLKFFDTMTEYYANPPGVTLGGILAKSILESECTPEIPVQQSEWETLTLTGEQEEVRSSISKSLNRFGVHCIHGITGSGKTEVFIELAREVIAHGGQVLYILPEISLTPQLTERVFRRLGVQGHIYHSKMTPKKRHSAFWSFHKGASPVLVGARSALFVPARGVKLIIVDEEHEPSYKQDEAPSYHLRDMAVLYAKLMNIPVVLASATPSIETVVNCRNDRYSYYRLEKRAGDAVLPAVEMLNMNELDAVAPLISERLYDSLYQTLQRGEQAILFLNRKGYSHTLICNDCNETAMCANCAVPLTWYKSKNAFRCQYCGEEYRRIRCECGCTDFFDCGAGTERIAEVIESFFPGKVLRLDTDSVTTVRQMSDILESFRKGEAQILVGTQMIAKGLHFPDVTLVGVLNIDNLLGMPDFRASERAYQLIVQVAGRAGRGTKKGTVLIQTYKPTDPVFSFALENPDAFYDFEIARREMADYPPFTRMTRLLFSHTDKAKIEAAAKAVADTVRKYHPDVTLRGPVEAPITRIKNRYRFTALLKAATHQEISAAIATAQSRFISLAKGGMLMKVDKDPYQFL